MPLAAVTPNKPGGNYVPVIVRGGFAFVSGQLPRRGDELLFAGKVGAEVDIDQARQAAELCADICLAALEAELGSLERIEGVASVTGYIASAAGFVRQSQVMDGASDRLVARLGERGRHARTSIGVAELPRGAPVEINLVAAIRA